jgi:hypothetical protein
MQHRKALLASAFVRVTQDKRRARESSEGGSESVSSAESIIDTKEIEFSSNGGKSSLVDKSIRATFRQ